MKERIYDFDIRVESLVRFRFIEGRTNPESIATIVEYMEKQEFHPAKLDGKTPWEVSIVQSTIQQVGMTGGTREVCPHCRMEIYCDDQTPCCRQYLQEENKRRNTSGSSNTNPSSED